ncbi:PAS domain S-box protein [candidate division KSB1 bacterium]|nr:PAS domain S-box protein [candidate division KSB1 bacterium]
MVNSGAQTEAEYGVEKLTAELDALRSRLYELEEMEIARVTEEQERFDSLGVLDEYAKQLEESRDKLTRLFRAAAAVQEARTVQATLQRIADAVHEAGWGSVSVSLFKNWAIVQAAYVGCTPEDIEFLESNRRSPEDRARQFGPAFERFKISRSYFVPAEELPSVIPVDTVVPGRREVQPGDEWNPMDLAYVPLYGSGGRVIGSVNCDDPVDGKRPTPEAFLYLELFADLAATKVETARLLEQQRRTAEAYRESEEKYRSVFTRSGDGFFLMDEYFRDCNAKACEIFACTRSDLIGASPVNFSPEIQPDGRPSTEAARAYIMAAMAGSAQSFYWKHRRKDGILIDCEVSLSSVEIGGEGLVLAIVRDITERRRVEAAMKENEERFRSVADATPVMIWMIDENNALAYLNRMGFDFLGLPPDQQFKADWSHHLHPDDAARFQAEFKAATAERKPFSLEYRMRRRDGAYRWVLNHGVPRYGVEGGYQGYIGSCLDVDDHKETVARLTQSQVLVQRILDASPDMLYVFDLREHRMLQVSPGVKQSLGFSPDDPELLSPNFVFQRVHPDDISHYNERMEELVRQPDGTTMQLQWRFRDKLNQWRWVESRNAVSLRDEAGNALQIVGSARDVTDQRLREVQHQVVSELSRLLVCGASRDQLLDVVPELIAQHIGFPIVAIQLLRPGGATLDYSGCYGMSPATTEISVATTRCGWVARTGEACAFADLSREEGEFCETARAAGFRGYVAAPLRDGDRVFGVLMTADREPRPEAPAYVRTLSAVADFLAYLLQCHCKCRAEGKLV